MRIRYPWSWLFDFTIYEINWEFREPNKWEFYIYNWLAYRAKYDMWSLHFICKPIH